MKKKCLLLCILCFQISLVAQSRRIGMYRLQAKKAVAKGDYKKAAQNLLNAFDLDRANMQVANELLELYNIIEKHKLAAKLVEELLSMEDNKDNPVLQERLADIRVKLKEYEVALPLYRKVLENLNSEDAKTRVQKKILNTELKKKSEEDGLKFVFEPLDMGDSINTIDYEYCPVISVDGKSLVYTVQHEKRGWRNEDIYISKKVDGVWQQGQPIPGYINTEDNEGAHSVSPEGKLIVLTICNAPDSQGSCDLYSTALVDGSWTKPKNMGPLVNGPHWDAHPTISVDAKTIYFSSERPGGKGSADIWKTELVDGQWIQPVNVEEVNSEQRELTPFIHPDNRTLYFVSDGHPGFGKLDIFMSKNENGDKWSTPTNFGPEINTEGEEFSLSVSADGTTAYYSKLMEKEMEYEDPIQHLDIFKFDLPVDLRANPVFYFRGKILDEYGDKVKNSKVQILNLDNNEVIVEENNQMGEFFYSFPIKYKYAIQVTSKGFLMKSYRFEFTKGQEVAMEKDIELEEIKKDIKFELKNVTFKTASAELDSTSMFELNNLKDFLVQNETMKIEIGGHTDNKGSFKYNQKLSENRAKSVYDYLVENKIAAERLTYVGYADKMPIADNETEEGRSSNRRTEVKILK